MLKNLRQFKEDAPANSMGAAGINGATPSVGGIAGFDPILGTARRKPITFKQMRSKLKSK
jgi:hypothetical protein